MGKFIKGLLILAACSVVTAGVCIATVGRADAEEGCTHEPVELAAVDPTCTETGLTAGSKCSRCGEVLEAQKVIVALGHDVEEIAAKAPSCTIAGWTSGEQCKRCHTVLSGKELIKSLGHDETPYEGCAATCTTDGRTSGTWCSRCDEVLIAQEVIPALGHSPEEIPAVAPTCSQTGLTAGSKCTRCGEILTAQEAVPALDHVSEIVLEGHAATCTEEGVTDILKCSRCNVLLSEQEQIPALGHELAELPAVAATCTQAGLSAGFHCERCDENVVPQETVPALGHTFGEWTTTSPKCYEEKIRKCEVCEEQERKYTQKQDHVQAQNGYHCEHCGKMLITVNGTEITGCDSALEELTVYYDADGIIIRSIAPYAFAEKNLRDVKIKTYLEYVGEYAFFGCYEDLRIALYTDYGANTDMERWAFEWYYGNGDFESPFYYYTTKESVIKANISE